MIHGLQGNSTSNLTAKFICSPIGERKRSQAQKPKPFPLPKELLFGKRLPFLCKILGMLLGIARGHTHTHTRTKNQKP